MEAESSASLRSNDIPRWSSMSGESSEDDQEDGPPPLVASSSEDEDPTEDIPRWSSMPGDSSEDDQEDGPPPLVGSSSEDEDPNGDFREAVMREDLESVEAMLQADKLPANHTIFHAPRFPKRMTSLEYAVHRGSVPLAQLLFAYGARPRLVHGAAGRLQCLQALAPPKPRGSFCVHGLIRLLQAASGENPDVKLDLLRAVQAGLGAATFNKVRSRLRFLCLCLMRLGMRGGSLRAILVHVLLDCINECLLHGRFVRAEVDLQPEPDISNSSEMRHQLFITTRYNMVWSSRESLPDKRDFPLSLHILDEHGKIASSSGQPVEAATATVSFEAPKMWAFSPPSFLTLADEAEPQRPLLWRVDDTIVPWSQDLSSLLIKVMAYLGMRIEDEGSGFYILNRKNARLSLRDGAVASSSEFPLSLHIASGGLWIMNENGDVELEVMTDLRGRLMTIDNRWVRFDGSMPHGTIGMDAESSFIAQCAAGSVREQRQQTAQPERLWLGMQYRNLAPEAERHVQQTMQTIEQTLPTLSLRARLPAAFDASLSVTQDMVHDEPAAYIPPQEAQLIIQQVEAGLVQRSIMQREGHFRSACITGTLAEDDSNLPVSERIEPSELATEDEFLIENFESQHRDVEESEDAPVAMTRLVLLNFTRHPPSFERALKSGDFDALRERREALHRAGHPEVLPCGTKILVSPAVFAIARQAVVGKQLGPSFVIVSEDLEPVVTAAVNSYTKHRENVRVKNIETLAYVHGDDCNLIVSRTFLDVPDNRPKTQSIAHSTTAIHGHLNLNPRSFV
eukprot:TRINITY_DN8498_c0_g1_i1.p1 TRINITY_DN8498_c0_g1~~TRINITY_DN8498_c0_g1_i1.p1  ORF type:complete len:793 (-),score=137.72 TRINITY_DN8498_c0_g1_i1:260-2638(-)